MPGTALSLLLVVAFMVAAGCGDSGPSSSTPAESVPGLNRGVSVRIPPGWQLIRKRISGVLFPEQVLAAASYPVNLRKAPAHRCHPGQALRQMPVDGALVQLVEYTPSGLGSKYRTLLSRTSPRPAHFSLPRSSYRSYECFGPSYQLSFKDRGRVFSAQVWVKRRQADAEIRSEASSLLDSLQFASASREAAAERHSASIGSGEFKMTCSTHPFIGAAEPDWRRQATSVGPFGFNGAGRDFRRIPRRDPADGLLYTKMPAIVEGHRPVVLEVPSAERSRVALDLSSTSGPYVRATFVPCDDRPRTTWAAGLVLRDRRPVTLRITVGGKRLGTIRVGQI